MITDYNTIIIGAGAAGLMAGCFLDKKAIILEKNMNAGKKILISGAGQCNYTHGGSIEDFFTKYGESKNFVKPALLNFTNIQTIDFLDKLDLESFEREDGKVFPKSLIADDVLKALQKRLKQNNTEIAFRQNVEKINYNSEHEFFTVKTESKKLTSKNIIVATGGKSYPTTGSTGDGYVFSENLGHTIIDVSPSLTPVNVENYQFSDLKGISFDNVNLSLIRDGKKIKDIVGDLLFTHKNLSGPAILNFSRFIRPNDEIKANFWGQSRENLLTFVNEKRNSNGKSSVKSIFKDTKLPKRFIDKIFHILEISDDLNLSSLNKVDKSKIADYFCEFVFRIGSLEGYNTAMATTGGVATNEINRKTMESKIVKGLYFAGEVIDVDGDTGGYNIQFAFSSGKLAAENINKKLV